ncbi:hypothetical protein F4775DRAFT_600111 [Biscogniauxia sp. FL1348]|nr:hypothetical protein F4775DRAFT_600111 [Biscogniauxia sp. FL1348]
MSPQTNNEPIAIIGSACRFAGGANSSSKLWELLKEPRDVLSEIPDTRFNAQGFYHEDGLYHGHSNVRHSYLLSEDPRLFDAQFFGVKPVEARALDPQQRFLLETVYEGLESAGLTVEGLRGSATAVYVGLMCNDYEAMMLRDHNTMPSYYAIGIGRSVMSNRISYFFDWHGPSMTIDTACSSSLYAVHLAVQALRAGETQTALACGSNIILGPESYISESKLKMLSPDSRSRMWDENANGYARGDGVACVVLKTLSKALADGDHIDCIIRETGVNQDGATNGITMPSASAQRTLIRDTYARAGLDLFSDGRPQYFEAHGTGTPAGDPIEAEAIQSSFFQSDKSKVSLSKHQDPLYVGSIKTVLGHTEGTAGVAAILKAALAVQNGSIPANMLFTRLHPSIEPFYDGLEVPTSTKPWPVLSPGQPRRASVNSFGFGGANAHAIIESYDQHSNQTPRTGTDVTQYGPYVFSANSEQALVANLEAYAGFLDQHGNAIRARDLAWTLRHRRSTLPVKVAFPAGSLGKLKESIDAALLDSKSKKALVGTRSAVSEAPRILGIFTGQGAQYARMGAELVEKSPFAQRILRELDDYLVQLPVMDRPTWSLADELLASPELSRVNEARISQPLCTAVQIMLVDMLRQAGVAFTGVVGHSSGEIGAAYAAGYLSARDAMYIAYYRGLHSGLACSPNGESINGAMLAVGTSMEDALDLLSDPAFANRVVVAASNSATSITLSGDEDAIEELEVILEDEKKFRRRLKVDKAYHSNHMQLCSEPYMESLRACGIQAKQGSGNCVWYSTVYEDIDIRSNEAITKMSDIYWSDNMVKPVLFSQGLERALTSDSYDFALEVGPHSALQGPASQTIQDTLGDSLPYKGVLTRGTNAIEAMSAALGFVWSNQQRPQVDLNEYETSISGIGHDFSVVKNLPSYRWDHERAYWHESRQSRKMRLRQTAVHPLLGDTTSDSSPHHMSWRNLLKLRELPWLSGHQLQGKTVFPAAGYISTMLEASRLLVPQGRTIRLIDSNDFRIHQAMPFDEEDAGIETVVEVSDIHHNEASQLITGRFTYSAAIGKEVESLTLMASADIQLHLGDESAELLPTRASSAPNMVNVGEDRFYSYMEELGYGYTGRFRALTSIRRKLGKAECQVLVSPPSDDASNHSLLVHPGMLDCAIQAVILAYCHPGDGQLWSLHVPTTFKSIRVNPSLCGSSWDDAESVPVSATTFEVDGPGLLGDVDIFGSHTSHSAIQIQGVKAVPFAAATAADDETIFSRFHWGSLLADGEEMARDDLVTKEQHELALAAERTAGYYMRKFDRELDPNHPARSDPTFSAYLNFGRHMINLTDTRRHRYAKKEWAKDTKDDLMKATAKYADTIDVRIIRAVGEAMPRVFEGETTILEHLLPTGLLTDYYVNALGMRQSSGWIGRAVEQLVHRYPRMSILEIGAGTGGATKSIFKRIGQDFESYTFTDVSTGFFEEAKSVFAPYKKRMIFRALDAGADPVAQGFTPGTYDLIVASFVIHATSNLEQTMRNVRKLLRPGGFVVLGEGTNQNWLRDGFVFGTLPGWWAGADEGRDLSPCIPPKRWDTVLRNTGFSGIDTITPDEFMDTYATSVFISQAVDERVEFLREPLSAPLSNLAGSPKDMLEDLVIIGGATLRTTRLVSELKRILGNFSQKLSHYETLAEVKHHEFSPGSAVLSLTDLDKPVFNETNPDHFEGLKHLVASEKTLLWVTSGRRSEDPFANMSVGFLRNAICENRELRFQSLDFEDTRPDGRTIAENLLRLEYMSETVMGHGPAELLWSVEPEIVVDANGRQLCSRLEHMADANDRYNSARRTVTREVNIAEAQVEIQRDSKGSYNVMDIPQSVSDSELVLQASHAILSPIRTSVGPRFLTFGTNLDSNKPTLTLAESLASTVPTSHDLIVECDVLGGESPRRLIALTAANMLAASIIDTLLPGQTLVVHNPSEIIAEIIARRAAAKDVNVFFTTDSTVTGKQSNWTSIPKYAAKRQVEELLPANVSLFASFSSRADDSMILSCLPSYCRTETFEPVVTVRSKVTTGSSANSNLILTDALAKALQHVQDDDADLLNDSNFGISSITPSDITDNNGPHEGLVVLEWPKDSTLRAQVSRLDSTPLFKGDKTYWLVGLSRSLGLSICDWMVARGARHIVITSRNPQVEASWEEGHRRKGATIKIIANDVSDADAVDSIYDMISSTMPPLAGIMQGAMVLNDQSIREMGVQELRDVFGPKVEGSRNLDRVLGDTPLDFLLFLSSMVNVVGNIGQANYCAANSYMSSLAAQRRKRGLAGSVVNIGVVTGAGYVTREVADGTGEKSLMMAGLRRISEGDTHQMLAEGIELGRASVQLSVEDEPEMSVGLRTISAAEEWQPLWVNNPKFARFIAKELDSEAGDIPGQKNGASLKDRLLAARSRDDVHDLIQETFLSKLRAIMLIEGTDNETLMKSRSNDIGMDSLIAVDVRSWMLKNYFVSIPVLEILGGVYISELVNKAVEEIPSELIPNVNMSSEGRSSLAPPIALKKEDVPTIATATSVEDTPQNSQIDSSSEGSSEIGTGESSDPPSEGEKTNDPMLAQLESLENHSTPKLALEKVQELSYSQSMFWVVHSLVEDKTTLNHTAVYCVRGRLRLKPFRNAVRAVGQRHEALRTCFYEEDGQAVQGILASGRLELEHKYISSEEEVDREYEQLQQHVYDLSSGRLMRIILLTRSSDEHWLLIGTHHINMDGICHQVFMHDVEQVYNGRATSLNPNVLQYPDFSAQQLSAASLGEWDADLAYWKQEFINPPEPLPLTRARVSIRKPLTQYTVNRYDIRVDVPLAQRIRAFVRSQKATSFHFYLAAFRVLLQRVILCGSDDDICIGIADANRKDEEMMSSFGPYVNLLPLRFQAQGHDKLTFTRALGAARDKTYAALRHSSPAFEAILHELQVTRTANHAPLFQTFVDYRQGMNERMKFAECSLEMRRFEPGRTAYDLSLDIIDNPGQDVMVTMLGQSALYSLEDIQQFAVCYEDILREFIAKPGNPIDDIWGYPSTEVKKALDLGKGISLQSTWPDTLLHKLDCVARDHADKIALAGQNHNLTYRQLQDLVHAIEDSLLSKGVSSGNHVAVYQSSTPELVCSMLAIMRIGAVYVPLDPATPPARLALIMGDCQPVALVVDGITNAKCEGVTGMTGPSRINTSELTSLPGISTRPVAIKAASQPAVVLYTSGTTGTPKGVTLSHANLVNEVEVSEKFYGLDSSTVVLQQSALGFDMSVLQMFLALALGGTLVIAPADLRGDSIAITDLIVKKSITFTCATPTEYSSWLRYGNRQELQRSSWAGALSGGEPIPHSLLVALKDLSKNGLRLFNGYGPTETTCCSTKAEIRYFEEPSGNISTVTAGRASPNESIYILDEQMRLLPTGLPGEIYIAGAGVACGYLNNPQQTKEAFLRNPFADSEYINKGWVNMYRTKDRGRLQADGQLLIEGRINDDTQVKIRGVRIDLQDIENTILNTAEGVISQAVASVRTNPSSENHGDSKFIVAHVVFSPESRPSVSEQREMFLTNLLPRLALPQTMRPSMIVPLESMPLTSSSKLDRRAINALPLSLGKTTERYDENDAQIYTETEIKLKAIWEQVLSHSTLSWSTNISPSSDFFHVGGTSMLLLEVRQQIRKQLGATVRLISLFENSTLSAMASTIGSQVPEDNQHTNWEDEASIPEGFFTTATKPLLNSPPPATHPQVILLTGVTGRLGQHVLQRLLRDPSVTKVICVAIRKIDDRISSGKLPAPSSRLHYYAGDLTAPRLGLSAADFNSLAAEVDAVLHIAAYVSHYMSYASMKAANVGSTRELARFCAQRRPQPPIPLHFVSTAEVAMLGRGVAAFAEESARDAGIAPAPHDAVVRGYATTKWVAERFLENAAAAVPGLRVWIHRPSSITAVVGGARGEDDDESDHSAPDAPVLQSLLHYFRKLRAVPTIAERLRGSLDLIAMDRVTEDIVRAVLQNRPDGAEESVSFLHHTGDETIPLERLREHLEAEQGVPFQVMELAEWGRKAEAAGMHALFVGVLENLERHCKILYFPKFIRRERGTV